MAGKQGFRGFRPKLVALAVASCFASSTALANPTGHAVVNGQVSVLQNGNLLQVTNSPNSIINWQSFSIGANEITRFVQQSQASAVLNRVVGAGGAIDPSVILGALQSNGRVLLVNPSGILFGAGAQVDVAGLIATSLNLSNADFLANKLKFTDLPGAGSVVNQGNITTGQGGQVYLVGPAVTNSGIITTPKGEVILAAGNSVELVNPGTPNLRVEIAAADNEARNLGQIIADSGRIGIYAGLVNQSGTIRANSVALTEDGRIVLKATRNATLETGSVTTANGPAGGSVTVQSGDTTLVTGTVEAKGANGQGGTVQILGDKVGVYGSALVDASGNAGGGTVLVGGDFQGKNPDIQNASATYFGSGATLRADAGQSGDGGKVIVWADDVTRAYGTITARGGAQSGNGGFVEVSGKQFLDFHANVNTSAPNGKFGTLLLDPVDVNIQHATTLNPGTDGGDADGSGLTFSGGTDVTPIYDSEILGTLDTTNVNIQASGSITVFGTADPGGAVDINYTGGVGRVLSLTAGATIAMNGGSQIRSTGSGGLSTQLIAPSGLTLGSGSVLDAGAGLLSIYSSGVVSLAPAATVNGANVLLSTYFSGAFKINSASVPDGINNFVITPEDLAKISVTTPASGSLTLRAQSGGNNLDINAPVTLDPAKVATLVLQPRSTAQVTQNVSAPLSVQKLAVDGGEGGNVTLLANNLVGTLAYNKPSFSCCNGDSFQFKNGQSLTIGSAGTFNGISAVGYNVATPFVVSVDVTGDLSVAKGITVTGANGSPTGQTANLSLSATGTISASENINVNGGSGTVQGSATTTISGQGGVNLTTANVGSLGGASNTVTITSSGGNINLGNGQVSAFGTAPGSSSSVTVSAPNGSIMQGTAGGSLATSGITEAIVLQARDGIGTTAAPIYVAGSNSFGKVTANNTGTGDLALQFGEFLQINSTANILNANPTGTYFLRVNPGEGSGQLTLSVPFLPGNAALQPGQSVHFRAPSGTVALVGPSSGSITGAAKVTLEAAGQITLQPSTSISAGNVLLKGGNMDIQGPVTATNNIFVTPFTAGQAIELGDALIGGALALSASELSLLTAPGLGIGTDGTTANTGALTVTLPIGPFNGFPNLFGSSITQGTMAPITATAGLNAFATGSIMLNHASNNIGSFGGTAGTNINLVTSGNIDLGVVTAGSSASITSTGGAILNNSGLANITSPVVSLTAATGIGSGIPIMLTNASPSGVTAVNSTSGGIGLLQPNGTFTVGAGGWNILNAPGGETIIEGLNVTLGAGAPSNGILEIFATNDAIVGSAGYTSANPLLLAGGNNVNVNGNVSASDLVMFAGNQVNINGVVAQGNTVGVLAPKLNITAGSTPAHLKAGTTLGVIAGEINLQGGGGSGAFAEMSVGPAGTMGVFTAASTTTSGNINLKGGGGSGAYARIFGDPDVGSLEFPVSVGGVINMDAGTGTGAFARIESASVNSIHVDFTTLPSGGFFVNGVENAVSSGQSGFFAGGQPAVPGQNFFASYGGTGSTVPAELLASAQGGIEQAINQVVAATNQQATLTEEKAITGESESAGVTGDVKDEKQKKTLPICGK